MAKSESTAVNALIDMVRSGKPAGPEAADDLFASPKAHAPRMTSTIPPVRGAGEVAPLPKMRAPTGTSQLQVGNQIRMSTAPPSRANTIPPLPQARGTKAPPPPIRASSPQLAQRASQSLAAPPAPRASQPLPAQARRAPLDEPITSKVEPVTNKPARRAPSPSSELAGAAPRATKPGLPGPVREAARRTTGAQRTVPPTTTPVAAPFEANPFVATPQYPAVDRAQHKIDQTGDVVSADNWFEASRAVEKVDETWVGTKPAPRRRDHAATVKKAVVPLVALAVVGFGVGYLVFHTATKKHATSAGLPATTHVAAPAPAPEATTTGTPTPSTESANAATATAGASQPEPPAPGAAPSVGPADPNVPVHPNANEVKIVAKGSSDETPAAAPAPAPAAVAATAAPVVHEVQTARGAVKLADIRIDSTPSGATVMLVDNGKTTFLGTTPVAASVDPSRSYDVVLTLDGRPTQMAHLDPSKTSRLDVTLGKAAKAAPAVKAAAEPKAETPKKAEAPKKAKHVAASAPTGGIVDPGFDAPAAPAADAGGSGTLMVSSKPPCEIWIDGKDTGMKTPQRAMALPAGTHKVTFSNSDENITKTVSVKITADQTTKLIQDLMAK